MRSFDAVRPEEAITFEMIAQRAYLKWLERGRPSGTAFRDWIEAEVELIALAALRAKMRKAGWTNGSHAGRPVPASP